MTARFRPALDVFRARGGTMRMSEAVEAGIARKTLYAMRDEGVVVQLSRGVYRLAALPGLEHPDLAAVARRIPGGVICLISALAFHELTTEVPHAVDVAVARGTSKPRVDYPPINVYMFSGEAFSAGIDTHTVDRQKIRIYCPEKSIADAFKYRNKLGLDVALEALANWRSRPRVSLERLLSHARICRVERVLRPYLEVPR